MERALLPAMVFSFNSSFIHELLIALVEVSTVRQSDIKEAATLEFVVIPLWFLSTQFIYVHVNTEKLNHCMGINYISLLL